MTYVEFYTSSVVSSALTQALCQQLFVTSDDRMPNVVRITTAATTVTSPKPGLALGLLIYAANDAEEVRVNGALTELFANATMHRVWVNGLVDLISSASIQQTTLTDVVLIPLPRRAEPAWGMKPRAVFEL